MDALISYLVKAVLISGILYTYYLLVLRNKKFHSYNRFYLLLTICVSVTVPLIKYNWYSVQAPGNNSLNTILTIIKPGGSKENSYHFTTDWWFAFTCCLVSFILCMMLLYKITWIYKVKAKHNNTKMYGFTFIETGLKQAPFTFLNNLFWKKGISLDSGNGEKIFKHELTHIKQKHTYDKLFSQITICLFWMNPFFWLIQKELNVIHEFIADTGSIDEGDAESFAKMLLQAHNDGSYLNPAHSFYYSSIKRRLAMITTSKNTHFSYVRRILALPILLLVVLLFSFTIVKGQTDPKLHPGPLPIQHVTIVKKAVPGNDADSVADVKVDYIKPDGTPAVLHLSNVKYGGVSKINHDADKQQPGKDKTNQPESKPKADVKKDASNE